MSVKQVEDGSWFVEIDRKGMPRTRRGGFESEEAARIFEREYLAQHHAHLAPDHLKDAAKDAVLLNPLSYKTINIHQR